MWHIKRSEVKTCVIQLHYVYKLGYKISPQGKGWVYGTNTHTHTHTHTHTSHTHSLTLTHSHSIQLPQEICKI